jgi:hypothetical protein
MQIHAKRKTLTVDQKFAVAKGKAHQKLKVLAYQQSSLYIAI